MRLLLFVVCCSSLFGQSLAEELRFEVDGLLGWTTNPPRTVFADDKVVHGGKWSARIERTDSDGFSMIGRELPMDFGGHAILLRGYLKTENVAGFAGLWLREDGDTAGLAFDNMQSRELKGTTDWTQYSIALPRVPEAKRLVFGALLAGTGKAWVDDLELLVDGKPVWLAPKQEVPKTVLDTDHQFDKGSGVVLNALSSMQIQNLATLGKVWGFVKYHHPRVAAGELHWDYELMRALPAVLDATDRTSANRAIAKWVAALGPVRDCQTCAKLDEADLHLRPENGWIDDQAALGPALSAALRSIHRNRPTGPQFYISMAPGVGNPVFQHELSYSGVALPDAGFQLLGLFRYWNIIRYWFPYRDVIDENWDAVLAEFIPRIALARDADAHDRELFALVARVHDTHGMLSTPRAVQPPAGKCTAPVAIRFVGDRAVITEPVGELKAGDVLTAVDGIPVRKLFDSMAPYYPASNEAARRFHIAAALTRGECGTAASLRALRGDELIEPKLKRSAEGRQPMRHDRPGDTLQAVAPGVAYLKLSSVRIADVLKYVEGAKDAKGLIIDIRNYPSEFMVFALGSRLVEKATPFVRFTHGDLANPGAFHWTAPLSLAPGSPGIRCKVVVLVDETTISQAEYTTMAFRAAGATVIGSMTQGADGNVSGIVFPSGARTGISGIGVFYPDKRPTQRVGIVPDIQVLPTLQGLRAGRDEVLERAVREITRVDTR